MYSADNNWTSGGKIVTDYGANAAIVAKAAPGVLAFIHGKNTNAAVRYLQVHDRTTVPTNEVPLLSFMVKAGDTFTWQFQVEHNVLGVRCVNGIVLGWSTTLGTYTAATASDHSIEVGIF